MSCRFTPEERAERPQLCYGPFGLGPRICIGMRLGLLQVKVPLIELLKRYTFMTGPDTEVSYSSVTYTACSCLC